MFHVKTHPDGPCRRIIEGRYTRLRPARLRPSSSFRSRPGESHISYTSVLLAIVVGIAHAGLAPEIEVAGVRPNLILVAVVLVTALAGFGPGVVWAFAGGVTANLISTAPIGSIPLSLLLVAALAAGGDRVLGRLIWLYPILAAFVGSILADLVIIGVFRLLGNVVPAIPVNLILPAAVLNAAIAGLLLYPARLAARRVLPEERPAW